MEGCHVSGAGMVHTLSKRRRLLTEAIYEATDLDRIPAAVYAANLRGDLIMRGCVVSENASSGIHVGEHANFKAENCDVSYNGGYGMILDCGEGHEFDVRRCKIWRNMKFQLEPSRNLNGITFSENHIQNRNGEEETDEDDSE